MNPRSPNDDAPLPSPLARQVNEACERFEADWKAAGQTGPGPRIEAYLEDFVGPQRVALLRELVLLDADYRRLAGNPPRPEEYRARFPNLDRTWLDGALEAPTDALTLWEPRAAVAKSEPDHLPAAVGGYRLIRRLGGGGMGTVYEAEEVASSRRVALKFLAPELADSPEAIARFRAEGRLASAIAHPRCVFVLAADEDAGRPYIVMELMPGDTLADLVKRHGPLGPRQAVAYILDVIDGLQEAHRAGVIHRDVKPSNCFLTADDRVKVGDFGLAKSLARDAGLTKSGTFLGTPLFASPEQIKQQAVDLRTDVYSVAATLYYLLAGQAPFEGEGAMAVMARIVSEAAPPLRGQRPDVPPGLERVLLRGLERDRDRRPQTLEEFRVALLPFSPQRSSAGTPAWRFAAHMLDGFLFALLGLDFGLFALLLVLADATDEGATLALFLVWNGLWLLYFTLLEGLWGYSLGKFLFGLRVCAAGGSDPPGLPRALVRTSVHFAIVYLAGNIFQWMAYKHQQEEWWWSLVNVLTTVLGAVLLLSTMRRRNGYRGPHDLLSGTWVVMLPRSEAERLPAERPPARAVLTGARPPSVPECLGSFTVQGALCWTSRQKILTATDAALDRTVWIDLRPLADPPLPGGRRDLHRTGRLRWLGGGVQDPWQWDAFLAPTGVSAVELVASGRLLWWHQARPLLEQLADELAAACEDGTLPAALTLNQVWVRPGGLVLLLDTPPAGFPEAAPQEETAADQGRALALLRQTAVLLLDRGGVAPAARPSLVKRLVLWGLTLGLLGAAAAVFFQGRALLAVGLLIPGVLAGVRLAMLVRAKLAYARKDLIRSPVPGHADALLARLLGTGQPYATVQEVRAGLDATRDRPARVTPKLRLAHLATLGSLLAPGLFLMFFFSQLLNALTITVLQAEIPVSEKALHVLDTGNFREFVHAHMGRDGVRKVPVIDPPGFQQLNRDDIVRQFSDPQVRRDLARDLEQQRRDLKARLEAVNLLERYWRIVDIKEAETLLKPDRTINLTGFELGDFLEAAHNAQSRRGHPEQAPGYAFHDDGRGLIAFVFIFVAMWPACCVLWAFLWRGGLTYRFQGLSLVLANGHRALRLQCAWRALVVWIPVGALATLAVWLEAYHPELARWSWACWGGVLVVLLGFAGLALRSPARGLHDRLAGTYVVPR